jgi:hypothetical protein
MPEGILTIIPFLFPLLRWQFFKRRCPTHSHRMGVGGVRVVLLRSGSCEKTNSIVPDILRRDELHESPFKNHPGKRTDTETLGTRVTRPSEFWLLLEQWGRQSCLPSLPISAPLPAIFQAALPRGRRRLPPWP